MKKIDIHMPVPRLDYRDKYTIEILVTHGTNDRIPETLYMGAFSNISDVHEILELCDKLKEIDPYLDYDGYTKVENYAKWFIQNDENCLSIDLPEDITWYGGYKYKPRVRIIDYSVFYFDTNSIKYSTIIHDIKGNK